MATTSEPVRSPQRVDFMPLRGIDHVELWVGNAAQASYFFCHAFGFSEVAYLGLETGSRERVSRVLAQGDVRLVLTGALHSDTEIARHHARHGDGVKVIALSVPDVEHAYREATARGASGLAEPHEVRDAFGAAVLAEIATYGDTIHRFVDRSGYEGPFLPGFAAARAFAASPSAVITGIDHIVGNVELGAMDRWVSYYEKSSA